MTSRFSCTVIASKEAGPGKLAVNVRAGGADVDSLVREGDNGIYEIAFHPTRAAPHRVHIKYNEVHIPGTISTTLYKYAKLTSGIHTIQLS